MLAKDVSSFSLQMTHLPLCNLYYKSWNDRLLILTSIQKKKKKICKEMTKLKWKTLEEKGVNCKHKFSA